MPDRYFTKGLGGLIPADADTQEWLEGINAGKTMSATIRMTRNGKFLRKFFALLKCAYANHDWPMIETQWGPAQCTYEQFRKFITVKCGHFDMVVTPRGDVRAEAKSISFAKMSEDEFDKLYNDALNFILAEYLSPKGWTEEQMNNAVNQIMSFG